MKTVYSLFPKLFQHDSPDGLADVLHETGIDNVDLLIRDGYWVTPANLDREAADFVRLMRRKRIGVTFATTSYTPDMLLADPSPLAVLADLGISGFRMGYFSYKASVGIDIQLAEARARMERLAELCRTYRLKAVYQVHHGSGQLVQHSLAALSIVQGLPAEHVGIMLDPGNQFHEGREHYGKAAAVLGDYLAAFGVKDVAPRREADKGHLPGKGWATDWAPCHEGLINWREIGAGLGEADRELVINFQPFYHPHDRMLRVAALKEEAAYIRDAFSRRERWR